MWRSVAKTGLSIWKIWRCPWGLLMSECFHRYRLDAEFALYFHLDTITPGDLEPDSINIDGMVYEYDEPFELHWGVLPMGFTWSLYFVQKTGEANLRECASLSDSVLLSDKGASGIFLSSGRSCRPQGQAHVVYVDNLGVSRDQVDRSLSDVTNFLDEVGLTTHEREISTCGTKAVGTHVDLVKFRTTVAAGRYWKVQRGLEFALSCKQLMGRAWEFHVGHCTFIGPQERGPLSVLHIIYAFSRTKQLCLDAALGNV